jgi:hypothetical protein
LLDFIFFVWKTESGRNVERLLKGGKSMGLGGGSEPLPLSGSFFTGKTGCGVPATVEEVDEHEALVNMSGYRDPFEGVGE